MKSVEKGGQEMAVGRRYQLLRLSLLPILLAAARGAGAADIVADSADDVCAPIADPCEISSVVEIVPGATLDFGVRTVRLTPSGRLEFPGVATVLAGPFEVDAAVPPAQHVIVAKGFAATVTARRGCSIDPAQPCLVDADCALGTCSVGTGNIDLSGTVFASYPGTGTDLFLTSSGHARLRGVIRDIGPATFQENPEGGEVTVTSTTGSIQVEGQIRTPGFNGGKVQLLAALDIVIQAQISANGHEGRIQLDAGRDVLAAASLNTPGGSVTVVAARDARFETTSGRLRIGGGANSNASPFVTIFAGRDLIANERVQVTANSNHQCRGFDGHAAGDLSFHGRMTVRCRSGPGIGGDAAIWFEAGGNLTIGPTARIRSSTLRATVEMAAAGQLSYAGKMRLNARQLGASVLLAAGSDMAVSGEIRTRVLEQAATVALYACNLNVLPSARIKSRHAGTDPLENTLTAREQMTLAAGSQLSASTGVNRLIHRTGVPPIVNGDVSPPPLVVEDPMLTSCGP